MNNKPTILIVDEDNDIKHLLCCIMEENGYDVVVGDTADIVNKGGEVDLILLDLKFEGPDRRGSDMVFDGPDRRALEELRKRKIWTPVVVITSADFDIHADSSLRKLRIVDVIKKKGCCFSDLKQEILRATSEKLQTKKALEVIRDTNAMLGHCLIASGHHRSVSR